MVGFLVGIHFVRGRESKWKVATVVFRVPEKMGAESPKRQLFIVGGVLLGVRTMIVRLDFITMSVEPKVDQPVSRAGVLTPWR